MEAEVGKRIGIIIIIVASLIIVVKLKKANNKKKHLKKRRTSKEIRQINREKNRKLNVMIKKLKIEDNDE